MSRPDWEVIVVAQFGVAGRRPLRRPENGWYLNGIDSVSDCVSAGAAFRPAGR